MSFTPESFDVLLAQKLAQAPEPAYDPTHWDQLEDQLQHLNQSLQTQHAPQQAAPTTPPPAAPAAGWLAGPLAKLGVVAALAGLTATNAYLVLNREPQAAAATQLPAVVTVEAAPASAPTAAVLAPATATPRPVAPGVVAARADRQALPRRGPTTQRAAQPAVQQSSASAGHRPPTIAPISAPDAARHLAAAPAVLVGATGPAASPSMGAAPAAVVAIAKAPVVRPDTARQNRRAATATVIGATDPDNDAALERLALTAPNIITPNGDGLNDRFELPLPAGTYRLVIMDRRGGIVFTSDHYDNSWEARDLPAGTYYYTISTISTSGASPWRTTGSVTVQR